MVVILQIILAYLIWMLKKPWPFIEFSCETWTSKIHSSLKRSISPQFLRFLCLSEKCFFSFVKVKKSNGKFFICFNSKFDVSLRKMSFLMQNFAENSTATVRLKKITSLIHLKHLESQFKTSVSIDNKQKSVVRVHTSEKKNPCNKNRTYMYSDSAICHMVFSYLKT